MNVKKADEMEDSEPIEAQHFPERWRRFLLVAGVLMVLLVVAGASIYTWFALYGPCTANEVETASAALTYQLELFDAMYQSITSLTPIAIIGPITQMQQILMDTKEVVVPACLQVARNELITAMEGLIRTLLAVMESKSEATITRLMKESTKHLDKFNEQVDLINKCTPLCH